MCFYYWAVHSIRSVFHKFKNLFMDNANSMEDIEVEFNTLLRKLDKIPSTYLIIQALKELC